ncbi:unnamed protein product [Nesidiocoris tenuis]|uniref:Uncharacterized protein n=1 Tax=Nesidiocoris tenuis TaxID=355587 RepID=A0A6H5G2C5_9HEMI|nr:unnamed protein product [Nesidiocoris tenuis]
MDRNKQTGPTRSENYTPRLDISTSVCWLSPAKSIARRDLEFFTRKHKGAGNKTSKPNFQFLKKIFFFNFKKVKKVNLKNLHILVSERGHGRLWRFQDLFCINRLPSAERVK